VSSSQDEDGGMLWDNVDMVEFRRDMGILEDLEGIKGELWTLGTVGMCQMRRLVFRDCSSVCAWLFSLI